MEQERQTINTFRQEVIDLKQALRFSEMKWTNLQEKTEKLTQIKKNFEDENNEL